MCIEQSPTQDFDVLVVIVFAGFLVVCILLSLAAGFVLILGQWGRLKQWARAAKIMLIVGLLGLAILIPAFIWSGHMPYHEGKTILKTFNVNGPQDCG